MQLVLKDSVLISLEASVFIALPLLLVSFATLNGNHF